MRILFLDFDGVINSTRYLERMHRSGVSPFYIAPEKQIDSRACAILNDLAALDARIVVSSTWRHGYKLPKLREILSAAGLVLPVVGVTPILPYGCREDEIRMYLARHPEVTAYAVVDDLSLACDRFVETDEADGIQPSHVAEIAALLLRPIETKTEKPPSSREGEGG